MPQTVEALLDDIRLLGEEQQQIVQAVRALVKKTINPCTEQVKYGGILFTSTVPFGGVFAYKEHVTVEFSYGAKIVDEHGFLEGQAKGRRHIKLRSFGDVAGERGGVYLKLEAGAAKVKA